MSDINIPKPTLFSKPGCVQCNATLRYFNTHNIPFHYIDVTESESAIDQVRDMGYTQVPVVVYNFEHFYGFRPDLLEKIREAYAPLEEVQEAA